MGLFLILPILVCGYIYCNGSFYRQATINKYQGQLLYLLVAKLGLYIFLLACALSFALIYLSKQAYFSISLPGSGVEWSFNLDYIKYLKAFLIRNRILAEESVSAWVFFGQASIMAFYLASLLSSLEVKLVMRRFDLNADQARAYILYENVPNGLFTKQLLASMQDRDAQYMFSMEDRKVYIGRVSSVGAPDETKGVDEDFAIVPVSSGYRDKDTLELKFTTYYDDVVEQMRGVDKHIGFSIVLSQKNLVSVSKFEKDIWEKFRKPPAAQGNACHWLP